MGLEIKVNVGNEPLAGPDAVDNCLITLDGKQVGRLVRISLDVDNGISVLLPDPRKMFRLNLTESAVASLSSARRMKAFGAKVMCYDPQLERKDEMKEIPEAMKDEFLESQGIKRGEYEFVDLTDEEKKEFGVADLRV